MMSFLTYITGFFMNFELLPTLTDYANQKKGGMKLKKSSLKLLSQSQLNFADRTALTDTILKGDHLRIISTKFG
jgi:hypothetical protein